MKTLVISTKLIYYAGLGKLNNGQTISVLNVILLALMSIGFVATIYDVYHARKLIEISEVIVGVCASFQGNGKYAWFLLNRRLLFSFTENFQRHISGAMKQRAKHYEQAIQIVMKIFQIYSTMTAVSTLGVIMPREWFASVKHFVVGGESLEVIREYPLRITWFDSAMEYPYYPYQFAILATYVFLIAVSHCIADIFFFENCLLMRASLKDLQDVISKINEVKITDLNQYLKSIVGLHTENFRLLDMFRAIVSGPIFLMYIDMSAIAVANVFQVESALRTDDPNLKGSIARSLTIPVTVLFSLLIYCFMADEISYQNSLVADVAYQTNWYELSPRRRRFLMLIMARAQPAVHFYGFKLVLCNLNNFAATIRLIGSAVMIFHNFSVADK